MIYVGYFYNWDTYTLGKDLQSTGVIDAISNCDAGTSLAIGSTVTLFIVAVYYICMKALSFKEITESFTQGFKTMVPAILILTFAWTLSGIMGAKGGYLDAQGFVQNTLSGINLGWLFPSIFFLLACGIAFSTGTSWGTFGVLIPISTAILGTQTSTLTLLTVSAILGGAVFGDHISPISDTTILASAGANCNHVNHVKTQLPYAGLIAIITFVAYLVGGIVTSLGSVLCVAITWVVALVLFAIALFVIKARGKNKEPIPEFTPTEE
jgi:Na+/H+ antiporter NhaC